MADQTYWNGEPCVARQVRVVMGKCPVSTWWCAGMDGQTRKAVEVEYGGEKFYIDNEDGEGWRKVTIGRGSPWHGHRSISSVAQVIEVDDNGEAS